jgi:hypothetical protein
LDLYGDSLLLPIMDSKEMSYDQGLSEHFAHAALEDKLTVTLSVYKEDVPQQPLGVKHVSSDLEMRVEKPQGSPGRLFYDLKEKALVLHINHKAEIIRQSEHFAAIPDFAGSTIAIDVLYNIAYRRLWSVNLRFGKGYHLNLNRERCEPTDRGGLICRIPPGAEPIIDDD